jgi:hypothetical protein
VARWLKQSTSVDVAIGPFVDATDGATAETALSITQADIRLKKNAAAWAQKNAAQTLTHEENGYYEVTLDATDTNTLGLLRVAVHEAAALPVWEDFIVLPANVYDALVAGSDKLDVNLVEWEGSDGASAQIALAVWDELTATGRTGGSFGQLFKDNINATIGSRSTHSAADVWAVGSRTLTAFSTGLALSVWDVLEAAVGVASSMGAKVKANLDAQVSTRSSHAAADVWAVGSRTITGGTVGTVGAGAITAPSFGAGAIDAAAVDPDAWEEAADVMLTRDFSAVSEGGATGRYALQALRALRNRVDRTSAALTVTKEDDSTTSWSAVITQDAALAPVTTVNPA